MVMPPDQPESPPPEPNGSGDGAPLATPPADLDLALSGEQPCIVCRYDLQGLSIGGVCPECGTAIRATLLFRVDPLADEFRPLPRPKLTAAAIGMLGIAAFAAAAFAFGREIIALGVAPPLADILLALLGIGFITTTTLAFVSTGVLFKATHPEKSAQRLGLVVALCGIAVVVACSLPLAFGDFWDAARPSAIFPLSYQAAPRAFDIIWTASFAMATAGAAPLMHEFHARSVVMRTGQVRKQQFGALWGALAMILAGQAIQLTAHTLGAATPNGDVFGNWRIARDLGYGIALLGSLLLTLGVIALARDCWHIRRVILLPGKTLAQLTKTKSD